MASAYLPIETVLKVDDNEFLLEDSEKPKHPTLISFNCVSIGTQCDWKFEQPDNKNCTLLSETERPETELAVMSSDSLIIPDKNTCDSSMVIRSWSEHSDSSILSDQKIFIPATFSQQFASHIHSDDEKSLLQLSETERPETELAVMSSDSLIIPDKNTCDSSMVIRSWSEHSDSSILSDQKIFIPATFSQQFASHIHSDDEKSLLQLDYKTRNKYKTKQRRQDPFYRSQERVRQRTVMRLKRQDPGFREAEREKGRYRMRLKRLDPKFRSQERERQRERMKAKRRDPEFREREREQQKTRLHVKRLDPAFKEKERAQDRLRMRLKRQNNSLFANLHADDIKVSHESDLSVTSDKMLKDMCKSEDSREEFQNQTVFPENFSAKLLSLKSQESVIETFHFKKQQILNFNFYNTNKEQWLQEMCSRAVAQTSDISESDTLQSASVAEVNSDMMQKLPLIKKKDLKDESSSESLEKIKSSELSLSDLQKYTNSSHITVSTDKYSSTNTEN